MRRREFLGLLGSGVIGAWQSGERPIRRADGMFVERWSWAMGQPVHVMVFAESEDEGLAACAGALAELRRIEARLSLFDDASDLAELNRHAGGGSMRVDRDLRRVLAAAERFRRETGGAFDAAVEPLMRVWGFHRPRPAAPGAAEIAEAREAVATAVVRLDGERAGLPNADTQLDFGGIGVGYGIDCAVRVLRRAGIRRGFVDVSGDCYGIGAPPGERGWRVDIAHTHRTVELCDAALATSANSESVIRYGGVVRGHVMDPATGWPADGRCQVSVTARTAMAADARSTAALVSTYGFVVSGGACWARDSTRARSRSRARTARLHESLDTPP